MPTGWKLFQQSASPGIRQTPPEKVMGSVSQKSIKVYCYWKCTSWSLGSCGLRMNQGYIYAQNPSQGAKIGQSNFWSNVAMGELGMGGVGWGVSKTKTYLRSRAFNQTDLHREYLAAMVEVDSVTVWKKHATRWKAKQSLQLDAN